MLHQKREQRFALSALDIVGCLLAGVIILWVVISIPVPI